MSNFSFEDYQKSTQNAQNGANFPKFGFFKLAKSGDSALVRFNLSTTNDMIFAAVHKPAYGQKFEGLANPYAGISCLNTVGSYSDNCPFCKAAASGHPVIGKCEKKVYITMNVAYLDASGTPGEPTAVIWERPASFSRDLAVLLKDYGDLKTCIMKVTRTGAGKETRYLVSYVPQQIVKPETIPMDFSVFNEFKPEKYCYWVKDKAELDAYIANGAFPQKDTEKAPAAKTAPITGEDTVVVTPNMTEPVKQPAEQPAYQQNQAGFVPFGGQPIWMNAGAPAAPNATPAANTPQPNPTVGQTYSQAPWMTNQAPANEATNQAPTAGATKTVKSPFTPNW